MDFIETGPIGQTYSEVFIIFWAILINRGLTRGVNLLYGKNSLLIGYFLLI